ncbi:hypothetical protein ACRCPS_17955 [Pseudomonas aeruginosa]
MSKLESIKSGESSLVLWAPLFSTLYEGARLHPSHKSVEQVMAKLVLVGRALGLSMERRTDGLRVQDAGQVLAAAKLIAASRLHTLVGKLDQGTKLADADHKRICECHALLESLLMQAGAKSGAALAAAYLHVHRRSLFPLMGPQARIGAKLLSESRGWETSGLSRVTRPGGFPAWLALYTNAQNYLADRMPGALDLLQVNEHLEQWAATGY